MTDNKSPKTRRKSHNDEVDQAASLLSLKPAQVAIGFRVKSGRAIAVVLTGPADSPQVLARLEIKLCDPAVPDSIQPYHATLEMPGPKAAKKIERLAKIVRRATIASIGELVKEWHGAGHEIRGAGLVVGSLIDPATIKNDHIRAHALEGQLFRVSVEEALQSNGLSGAAIPERDVYSTAAAALGRSEDELKRAVRAWSRGRGSLARGRKNGGSRCVACVGLNTRGTGNSILHNMVNRAVRKIRYSSNIACLHSLSLIIHTTASLCRGRNRPAGGYDPVATGHSCIRCLL